MYWGSMRYDEALKFDYPIGTKKEGTYRSVSAAVGCFGRDGQAFRVC
jgi:hypothetical protein